jgi:HSP20 family protein
LSLPDDVDQERVEAKFAKGVLTVSLPRKTMPQSEVKRIEVKRSE